MDQAEPTSVDLPNEVQNAGFSNAEWRELCRQFGDACALCGSDEALVPDLVLPLRLGGTRTISNIQPLCSRCKKAKGRHLVDYRPFLSHGSRAGTARRSAIGKGDSRSTSDVDDRNVMVAKMITQRHLLAIEQQHHRVPYGTIDDPILEQDVVTLLIEEIKRLRALIVTNAPLARVESVAWRERYADLVAREEKKRLSRHMDSLF